MSKYFGGGAGGVGGVTSFNSRTGAVVPALNDYSIGLLAQSGAATGQAAIWSGSAWTPGTNFGSQNLITSGFIGIGVNPALTGTVRVPNLGTLSFRNLANSGDVPAVSMNAGQIQLMGETSALGFAIGGGGIPIWGGNDFSASQVLVQLSSIANKFGIMQFVGSTGLDCTLQIHSNSANTGLNLSVVSQNSNINGGNLYLAGGNSNLGTGPQGRVTLQMGGLVNGIPSGAQVTLVELANLGTASAPSSVVSLCHNAAITSTEVPNGDNIVYLGNAATIPTSNPVSGGELYASGGTSFWRGSGGTLTILGAA